MHKLETMLRLSDFLTYRTRYYRVGGSISQLWNTVRKMKFRTYLLLTLISKIFHVVTVDFVVCNTGLYICSSEVYLRFRTYCEVEIHLF